MKLNTTGLSLILPLIDAGTLVPTVIDEVKFFTAKVISIDPKTNSIRVEMTDGGDAELSAKLKYDGDNQLAIGATFKFNVEGEIKFIELPVVPEKPAQKSSTRSPDREACAIGMPADRAARRNR